MRTKHLCLTTIAALTLALSTKVEAAPLLDMNLREADQHDFVSFFKFKPVALSKLPNGIEDHIYANSMGCLLGLGIDKGQVIRHLKLIMPLRLLSDAKYTIQGRDLVKSYLNAILLSDADKNRLQPLIDEINVRDLDLHPASIAPGAKYEGSNEPIPQGAYKLGTGPSKIGDQLVFIKEMPVLAKTPSALYEAFMDKIPNASSTFNDCRLSVACEKSNKDMLVKCDAWEEFFWTRNMQAKLAAKPKSTLLSTAINKSSKLYSENKFADVIKEMKPYCIATSENLESWLLLGKALFKSGDINGSITTFNKACSIESKTQTWSSDLHLSYAEALSASGNIDAACEQGSIAAKTAPNDPQTLIRYGAILLKPKDPFFANLANRQFQVAKKMNSKDMRLPILVATANIEMGNEVKGLKTLKEAIDKTPDNFETHQLLQESKKQYQELSTKLKERAPAPVAVKDRKYIMPQGTMAVYADVDKSTGVVIIGLRGGHDPDAGKQDGVDDGIIELLPSNINVPTEILRAK